MVSLAIHWNMDPVMFHLGPVQVRWYGLLFISGFILGWYIFKWFFSFSLWRLPLLWSWV